MDTPAMTTDNNTLTTYPPLSVFLEGIETAVDTQQNEQLEQKVQTLLDEPESSEPPPPAFNDKWNSPLISLCNELPLSLSLLQYAQQQTSTYKSKLNKLEQAQKHNQQTIQALQQEIDTQTQQQVHLLANDPSLANKTQKALSKLTIDLQVEQQKTEPLEQASHIFYKPIAIWENIHDRLRTRLHHKINKNTENYFQQVINEQVIPLLQQAQMIATVTTELYRDTQYPHSTPNLDYPLLSKALPTHITEIESQPEYQITKDYYQSELDYLLN